MQFCIHYWNKHNIYKAYKTNGGKIPMFLSIKFQKQVF